MQNVFVAIFFKYLSTFLLKLQLNNKEFGLRVLFYSRIQVLNALISWIYFVILYVFHWGCYRNL